MDHKHHQRENSHHANLKESNLKLALSATLHCLLGCGLGEIAGMVIATWLGLAMTPSMILAIVLGFVFGMALGVLPLLRKKFTLRNALKVVVLAEGLSIAVMEFFEAGVQVMIPGVMESGLTDALFWLGMLAGLVAGFIAALPVNYVMIRKGVRHSH
jgi:hypothetical protein